MSRPSNVTTALIFTLLLALVSLSTRGLLLRVLNIEADPGLAILLAGEVLVLGVALLLVAALAFRPSRLVHRILRGLYVVAIIDASLWLVAGTWLWIALLTGSGGSMGGHGTADGLASAILMVISAPRMMWSVVKIILVVLLYRSMAKEAPPWLEAATAGVSP